MPGTHKSSSPTRRAQQKEASRQMRHIPTPAERALWERLRDRQVAGAKFRRQHSIDRFVVDFYCAEAQLVVEVDGPIHHAPNDDAERQAVLESLGLRVIRFDNDVVLRSTAEVVERINALLGKNPQPHP